MTHQLNQRELIIDLPDVQFEIKPIRQRMNGRRIIGPVDYGWAKYSQNQVAKSDHPSDVFTWGGGPLAGSRIPGTRRLVFCAYSPQWEGFYTSSLGGGAYIMHRLGVDFVCLRGRATTPSVLILNQRQGEIHVRLEAVNPEVVWAGYADPDGNQLIGFYALQQAVFDRYGDEYREDWVRIFAVGPASLYTNQGVIGSNHIKDRRLTPIDDWAGRGGLGSRLLQSHNIAACIFGGDWEDPDLKDSHEIDSYFQRYYNERMIKVDLGATEKYRYVPGFMTGGTFGVNMYTVDDRLFSFNYQSIYASRAERLALHDQFILNHYLRQFNTEIIQPKHFAHCGEPCSVACKKYDRIYKKDYEPYQALGPLCGVFDQRAAEELNHFVDAMGFDAIQMGSTVSWLMGLISNQVIPPQDFGLPPASELKFEFSSDSAEFDLVASSHANANYAHQIVDMILFSPLGEPFRQGIRYAAQVLDARYASQPVKQLPSQSAVFLSHGKNGCMTPNQYWVPGMFSPMPMMGKYFVYYGVDYQDPHSLGRHCVERMVYELFSENSGVCRFHRKWVEAIVDEIISAHYEFPVDYKAHQFELALEIYQQEGNLVEFWNSERVVDIIWQYLESWAEHGLKKDSLAAWVERFRADKWEASKAYWEAMRKGIAEAFSEGPENIPEIVPPYQAAQKDIMDKQKNS